FGRESFAFHCTLALLGSASYPVSVRRLDGFATPLLSALPSRSALCGSLRSLRPSSGRTFTSGPSPMLGTQRKRGPRFRGPPCVPLDEGATSWSRAAYQSAESRFRRLCGCPAHR